MRENVFYAPVPIIDKREQDSIDILTERYNKLTEPSKVAQIGVKMGELIPEKVKILAEGVKSEISEKQLWKQVMEVVTDGFKIVEEQAAKFSIQEESILKQVNAVTSDYEITDINQICLVRSYDLSNLVNKYKSRDLLTAFIEGGVTGAAGFWGLPFNIVLSVFLYFRAVQSIAMYYGYDVKNSSEELVIASQVFVNALSPSMNDTNNELTNLIGKVMVMTQSSLVKQTAKKRWVDMANRGGIPLILTQMRALAHKSAQKALEKAGAKGLENSLFRETFEQIGRRLTLKTIQKAVPVISGILGALIDTSQMKKVLEYADVFYQKRYIFEKESRIMTLIENHNSAYIQ